MKLIFFFELSLKTVGNEKCVQIDHLLSFVGFKTVVVDELNMNVQPNRGVFKAA
jgi:hypothetical protein